MIDPEKQGGFHKLLVALAILAFIFSFTARFDIYTTRIIGVFWQFGHVVAFYLWTYLCLKHVDYLHRQNFKIQFLIILVLSLFLGTVIELLQLLVGRSGEVNDVISDLIGALAALLFHSLKRFQLNSRLLLCLKSIILVVAIILHQNMFFIPLGDFYTYRQFPVLFNPATPFEKTRVKDGDSLIQEFNDSYMEVDFGTTFYSGISINFFPRDWSGNDLLVLEITNPESVAYEITCRIHDVAHMDGDEEYSDRFNQRVLLAPGLNRISIDISSIIQAPVSRDMRLDQISAIGLFTTELSEVKKMWLHEITLGSN